MVGALYVHVPFCARKCAYCDFASWETGAGDPLMADYVRALEAQLDEAASLGLLDGCETAYVGGGTPSLLGPGLLGSLVEKIVSSASPSELTCEANPDSLSNEVLLAVREAGATRLSVGVQSLNDDELFALGRLHDGARARERVAAAVASGLHVSADLMCATPHQTGQSWEQSLKGVAELGVGHVSVYPLQIEEGTPFERWLDEDPAWNDSALQAGRMSQAQALLESFGYRRYEVASYSLAGQDCRHNIAYWTGVSYLGLGTHASSMLTLKEYLRLMQVCPQLPKPPSDATRIRLTVESGRAEMARDSRLASLSFSLEYLTKPQAAAEDLMLGARLVRGLDPGLVARARCVLGPALDETLDELLCRGLLAERAGRVAPTELGWLLGNELYGALWDLAPGEVLSASC